MDTTIKYERQLVSKVYKITSTSYGNKVLTAIKKHYNLDGDLWLHKLYGYIEETFIQNFPYSAFVYKNRIYTIRFVPGCFNPFLYSKHYEYQENGRTKATNETAILIEQYPNCMYFKDLNSEFNRKSTKHNTN